MIKPVLVFCSLLLAGPVWAINKCTGAEGKVSFQDAPCTGQGQAIEVRPASGHAYAPTPQIAPAAAAALPAPTPAKAEGPYGPTWQRKTYLENRGVADARSALDSHYRTCEAKQTELSNRKLMSRNNLAGATWEQSISSEMQAVATTCDSRSRDLRGQLDSVERELRELQARQ